jgi:hypothetical protein
MSKRVLIAAVALTALWFAFGSAHAQNPTCPTRPAGDSSNSCASTAFVNQFGTGSITGTITPNLPVIGNAAGNGFTQGTRSGTTTKFPVIDGTTTNGQCAVYDASGGLSSVACSPSGSGTVGSGVIGNLAIYTGSTAVAGSALSIAANNTALSALASTASAQVLRLGYANQGDAPPQIYNSSNSACSLFSGTGDGGSQVTSSDGKCWLAVWPSTGADSREFGAVDMTGATDESTPWQNAINALSGTGNALNMPPGKNKIATPLDCHNKVGLTINGTVAQFPGFNLVNATPSVGSVLLGQTSAEVFDCIGGNSIHFNNIAISSVGLTNASKYGLLLGSSADTYTGSPGGADIALNNVVINLKEGINSIPISFNNGGGLSTWTNVGVSGDYGFALTTNNPLSVTPTYGTYYATAIGTDGMKCLGCSSLSTGGGFALYIEASNDISFYQFYTAQISGGGASYPGNAYPIYIKNSQDIDIKVEADYWPSMLETQGTIDSLRMSGILFPFTTQLVGTTGYIADFLGTSLTNSHFDIQGVASAPTGTHYMYNTTVTMAHIWNDSFTFNTAYTSNVGFFNSATGNTFLNLQLNGNTDTFISSFFINGGAAPASSYRIFINGIKNGTL